MSNFDILKKISKKKTKSIVGIILVFGLLLLPISSVSGTTSSQLNDLYNKQSQLNQDITKNQQAVSEKKKEAQKLSDTIKTLDGGISLTQTKIHKLEDDVANTQAVINGLSEQITQKETELNQEETKKNNTIRAIYQTGEPSTIELLVGANTLSEVIDQSQYFEMLEASIERAITEIGNLMANLESQKSESENKKRELANLKAENEAYQQGLASQKKEKELVLGDTKTQQKKFEEQVQEAKKLSLQVEAQIASIQAELSKSSSRTVMARDRGTSAVGFSWPANYDYISAYYGTKTPFQQFHTGIDLVNIPGTPIHASASGTVIAVADMMIDGHYYGYGKYVVIGHNARYSSLYAHLMAYSVSSGQEVKEGDVIGYLGNTGWSTGPHLHFEIWEYGNRQNPINYLP